MDVQTTIDPARVAAVEALIDLAQNQIAAGLSRAANIDMQALGLIGFDAALIAVVIAAQGLLGPRYWVAIPGFAVSIVAGGAVLAITQFDLGPEPDALYAKVEAAVLSGEEAIGQLFADLVAAEKTNKAPLYSKTMRLRIASAILLMTILYTTLAVVL